jgi:two-component system sensor histidine kinase VicK
LKTNSDDSDKIKQVISSLLSNAIKYSDKGAITITLTKTSKEILFSIMDEGRGVEEKDLGRIFDRFYQVNPGSKGSGIGLTIAKAWVEAHRGRIWAESAGAGKGTTIRFTLPL